MTNVAVCGSTGSIGTQTLEVIETEAGAFGQWGVRAGDQLAISGDGAVRAGDG